MRNVILVQPDQLDVESLRPGWAKIVFNRRNKKCTIPVGLSLLLVNIKGAHFIDNQIKRLSNEELAVHCLEHVGNDGIVGFGGTCFEWRQAADVSAILKIRAPNITTVYGGSNAKARPEKHKKYFDIVFNTGEEFLSYIGLEPSLPVWPTYSDIPKAISKNYDLKNIFSGYGCSFDCRFCASKYINNRQVYFRPIDSVIDEIIKLKHSLIIFREDNFTLNKPRLKAICSKLARLGIRWRCQSRVNSLDSETIKMMVGSGCIFVSCGFESGNDTTLKAINKGHTVDDIYRTVDLLNKYNLPYSGGFIVGLPNEGEKEIINTINFMRKIKSSISSLDTNPVQFIGLPVSELYLEVQEKNLVEYNWHDGEVLFCGTEKLTCKEVERLCN